jgi:hypothetical protein
MHDRADLLLGEDSLDQVPVCDIAFVEGNAVGDDLPGSVG